MGTSTRQKGKWKLTQEMRTGSQLRALLDRLRLSLGKALLRLIPVRSRRLALLLLCSVSWASSAHAQPVDHSTVKAAFLLRFGSFVDWPPAAFHDPSSPAILCLVGSDDITDKVEGAAPGERLGQRPVLTRRIESASADAGCHIVYVGGTDDRSVAENLRRLAGAPVLTITDDLNGHVRGMIHFVIADRRVRFRIDRAGAENEGLRIDSRLLGIALSVNERREGAP